MSHKLNVLFLCGWYPSRVLPTNGDFIQRHAEAVSLQHNVTVIHLITDEENKKEIEYSSEIVNGIETKIGYIKHSKNQIKKALLFLKAFKSLWKKSDSFNIIHLNEIFPFGLFCVYLKWVKKTPYIISEHWTDYKYPLSKKISFFQKILSKIIVKNASYVCPVTNDLKKSLTQFGLKGNYSVIGNVVNTEKFHPIEVSDNLFSIVHISNMNDTHKNVTGILNVIARLQQKQIKFHLKLIGENATYYRALSNKLGITPNNIEFINQIPHHKIIEHLQKANLFILFSNFENLPCVILEAFACGVPVISTNVGGISECFPASFGKLIAAKDEGKLEEEILKYYNKKNTIASKKEMHHFIDSNFSVESICKEFTLLYHKSLIL